MSQTVFRRLAAIHLALSSVATTAGAATINVSSATVARPHSDPARICVSLEAGGNEQIAGTENLLLWDGDCATMVEGHCVASPGHGKNLNGTVQKQRDFTYKALILSFSDTDPIPSGELYCCDFLVHAAPGDCCRVRVLSPGGSDPDGNSVSVSPGAPGELCVASDGRSNNRGGSSVGGINPGAPSAGGAPSGGGAPAGEGVPGGGPASGLGGGVPAADTEAAADTGLGAQPQLAGADDAPAAPVAQPPVAQPPAEEKPPVQQPPAPIDPAAAATAAKPTPGAPQPDAATPAAAPSAAAPTDAAAPSAAAPTDAAGAPPDAAAAPPDAVPGVGGEGNAARDKRMRPAGEAGAAKPSPRDVRRERGSDDAAPPRRLPLDEDEGWFGCQTTAAAGFGGLPGLAGPLVLLLLARRRRHI